MNLDIAAIDQWKRQSELGEVCGIWGCLSIPVEKCPHCGNGYCQEHRFVIDLPSHSIIANHKEEL